MRKENGFTMIELLIVIAIMSVMSAIAIPNIRAWGPNYRLRTAIQEAYSDFQNARVTAMREGVNCAITFDQPVDGTTYDYVVFVDADNDMEYDAGERVIVKKEWDDYADVDEDSVTFTNNDDGLPSIAFRANGISRDNIGGFGAGTLTLSNVNGRTGSVVIAAGGTVRIN